ncbi:MAG TPA: DNA polymerase III subunit chi [Rhodocyclaceae bacterium]|nr:DNA polymerase III subunit chi [Rhodocyclaceae bacterium]
MTKIFFYHGMNDRLPYALRLISGAWAQQKALTIYAPDPGLAQQLDNLLWTQNSTGFIPHCLGDSPLAAETPILIARNEEELGRSTQDQRLVNLSNELPPGFARYESLVEVVSQEDEVRNSGRERVRFYRERGYEVQFKDISGESA